MSGAHSIEDDDVLVAAHRELNSALEQLESDPSPELTSIENDDVLTKAKYRGARLRHSTHGFIPGLELFVRMYAFSKLGTSTRRRRAALRRIVLALCYRRQTTHATRRKFPSPLIASPDLWEYSREEGRKIY